MKKLLLLILLFALALASCKEEPAVAPTPEPVSEDVAPEDVAPITVSLSLSETMIVAPKGESVSITCSVDSSDVSEGDVTYQWYSSSSGSTWFGTLIEGAVSSTLVLEPFAETGIYYYYCTVKVAGSSSSFTSDVASVAYTALPTVYLNTPDGVAITSKETWMEGATISIAGAPDDSWNFSDIALSVKGRGNSTWKQPKKPYALKLDKKQSIMGMPKSKRWVLIANYLDNSFMKNSMAFFLSHQLGMDYTVRGDFVDLVFNGKYVGLYWLGEAIKVDSDRVNINEDDDYLIELDNYYDETWKFKSSVKNLPYMIKNDDSMTSERLEAIKAAVTDLENRLYPEEGEPDLSKIDIDSYIKFFLVNELMCNSNEMGHPKSCYFTYTVSDGIFRAGPVWDFDWSTLHLQDSCKCQDKLYYDALFKSDAFKARVAELWASYSASLSVDAEIERIKSQIKVASKFDSLLWGIHLDPSKVFRTGFDAYVNFLKKSLNQKLSVVDSFINQL